MEEPERRIFPKSSAFEALLARVYLELWELQDDPATFDKRVEKFAKYFLPTMFQSKVMDKLPNFNTMLTEVEKKIERLEIAKSSTDPFTAEIIDKGSIPEETANIAWEVWHAIVDVLTEMGFNFPMAAARPRRYMRA